MRHYRCVQNFKLCTVSFVNLCKFITSHQIHILNGDICDFMVAWPMTVVSTIGKVVLGNKVKSFRVQGHFTMHRAINFQTWCERCDLLVLHWTQYSPERGIKNVTFEYITCITLKSCSLKMHTHYWKILIHHWKSSLYFRHQYSVRYTDSAGT